MPLALALAAQMPPEWLPFSSFRWESLLDNARQMLLADTHTASHANWDSSRRLGSPGALERGGVNRSVASMVRRANPPCCFQPENHAGGGRETRGGQWRQH